MAKKTGHPGFAAVQKKIAGRYGMKAAGAIVAAGARGASPAAKRKNPRLENVRMPKRMSSRLSKRGTSR
jgi:hypothetical protein